MVESKPSRSAMNVTFVRAHLTRVGVVDDPYALQVLSPSRQRVAAALRLPGLRRLGRHASFSYLGARTLFFDEFVRNALDDGARQVVVLAAGYDSRSWRLARPGVTFFEVDRPATQADKRAKAPQGGPVYVTADVTDAGLAATLADAGFRSGEPTAFIAEGLTAYLAEEDVAPLFVRLAELGPPGSRLAVSFESGFERQPVTRAVSKAHYRGSGERWRFRLPGAEAPAFLGSAGWTIERMLTATEMVGTYLGGTGLDGPLNSSSYVVVATV